MLCGHIHRWIGFCLSRHLINKHHLGTTIGRAGRASRWDARARLTRKVNAKDDPHPAPPRQPGASSISKRTRTRRERRTRSRRLEENPNSLPNSKSVAKAWRSPPPLRVPVPDLSDPVADEEPYDSHGRTSTVVRQIEPLAQVSGSEQSPSHQLYDGPRRECSSPTATAARNGGGRQAPPSRHAPVST